MKNRPKLQKKKVAMDSPLLFQLDSPVHKKRKKKSLFDNLSFNIVSSGSSNASSLTSSPVLNSKAKSKVKKETKPKTTKRKVAPRERIEMRENVPDFASIEKFELVVESADNVDQRKTEKIPSVATSTPAKSIGVQRQLKFRPSAILPSVDIDETDEDE